MIARTNGVGGEGRDRGERKMEKGGREGGAGSTTYTHGLLISREGSERGAGK